jgi:hypothetical protein
VHDQLQDAFDFVAAWGTGWTCAAISGLVTCQHLGPVDLGTSLPVLTIRVIPNTYAGSPFTNRARVESQDDVNPSNDTDEDAIIVGGPVDLALDVEYLGGNGPCRPGGPLGCNMIVTVTNVGERSTYEGFSVTCTSPTTWLAMFPPTSDPPGSFSCSSCGGTCFSCGHYQPIAPGESAGLGLYLQSFEGTRVGLVCELIETRGDHNPANDEDSDGQPP